LQVHVDDKIKERMSLRYTMEISCWKSNRSLVHDADIIQTGKIDYGDCLVSLPVYNELTCS
jgi:hypothetical protein